MALKLDPAVIFRGVYTLTGNEDAVPFRICDIHTIAHNRRLVHIPAKKNV